MNSKEEKEEGENNRKFIFFNFTLCYKRDTPYVSGLRMVFHFKPTLFQYDLASWGKLIASV